MGELSTTAWEPAPRQLNSETLMRLTAVLWLLYTMVMLLIMLLTDNLNCSISYGQCLAITFVVVLVTELSSGSIPRACNIVVFYTSLTAFVSIFLSGGMSSAGTLGIISLGGVTALQTAGSTSKRQFLYMIFCLVMLGALAISDVAKLDNSAPPLGTIYLSYVLVILQLGVGAVHRVYTNDSMNDTQVIQVTTKTEDIQPNRNDFLSVHPAATQSTSSVFCKNMNTTKSTTGLQPLTREQGAQTNLPDLYSYSLGTTIGMETLNGENDTPRYRVKRLQEQAGLERSSVSPRKKTNWMEGGLIGQGAFGKVHVALNIETGELMAVKKITFSMAASVPDREKRVAALKNEIDVMKKFDHPHIVKYLFADKVGCTALVFMEYVAGGSIQLLLQNFGPLHESTVVQYTFQLLQGLAYLHANSILHRDIKCANLLLTVEGSVKLADFGSCKYLSGASRKVSDMHGTPLWMAPEVLRESSEGATFASDIWSTGCTVMEMLTAKTPWSHYRSNNVEMLQLICDPDSQLELPPGISVASIKFLKGCLRNHPSQRLTAEQLIAHHYFYEDAEDIAEQMCSKSLVLRANAKQGCQIDTPKGCGNIIDCESVESSSPALPCALNPIDPSCVSVASTRTASPTPFSPTAVPKRFFSEKDFAKSDGVSWFLNNAPIEKTDNKNLAKQLLQLRGQRASIIHSLLDEERPDKRSPIPHPIDPPGFNSP
eukprot:TRINITY_DN24323_c0_g1_i1.p1 TRINITY_DN24323_c0_g1~~TRINITY_DN24323_c0_g1_i1.p1  ORF type:complete len:713 (+),score=92.16 TRINITY_DN24323_c0_g1_i1:36-2174(+)